MGNHHHHHRGDSGGSGGSGGAAAVSAAIGRPFSSSPNVPGGRNGRLEAFLNNNGTGDGNGDYELPLLRSASCRPYNERQQQHSRGGGGDRLGEALSLSSSLVDKAATGLPIPPFRGASDWSGVSGGRGDVNSAEAVSVFGGHRARQQQQQWEQRGARHRAIVGSVTARLKVRCHRSLF